MIKITKRLVICILTGCLLGGLCVFVSSIRFGATIPSYMLFSLWFNRLLMGVVIGAPWGEVSLPKSLLRGALLGITVSFAYFISTGFSDTISFFPGLMQGIIMETVVFFASKRSKKNIL